MKPILVTSGEPAGIGPDICLALADCQHPVVVLGDITVLAARAKQLGLAIKLEVFNPNKPVYPKPNNLIVWSMPTAAPVLPGHLNSKNARYVIDMLAAATEGCLAKNFKAMVTAPVNKAVINEGGIAFTGHTEFLAEYCKTKTVVMMLATRTLKVALVTTHLPLRKVAETLNQQLIVEVIRQLNQSLRTDFGIQAPIIYVAGLNPHAGENGYLGTEEKEIIIPALELLQSEGIRVFGPFPADTMFTPFHAKQCDVFVAMYHDQGLPVLKYSGFGRAVNVTLGLPIIRTSVDHGTALEVAGTGGADASSLKQAVEIAATMSKS